jgi:P2-related tail formation protein
MVVYPTKSPDFAGALNSLLPSNATALESSLEQAFHWDFEPNDLRGFKFKTEAVPYLFDDLVYEYGLESVSLWLEDSTEILREGLLFQRLRGTPAALKMSLKWTGLEDVIIEEEPAGEHFAEFQLGLEGLPNNFSIDAIKALTDMAKPVRTRLTRLYNSLYDRRHLILDQNQYGDFLSDYSGIRDASTLQISFGRETEFGINATLPNQHLHYKLRDRISILYNSNVFVLDSGILDEDFTELFDPGFVHEHSFIFEMPDGIALAEIPQTCVSQAKSQLILSDDDPLGSENTALGSFFVQETGGVFVLGEDALSDHLWEQTKTEVLERFTDEFFAEAAHPQTYETAKWSASTHFLYAANPSISASSLRQTHFAPFTAAYTGAIFWHDHRHLDRPWNTEEAIA